MQADKQKTGDFPKALGLLSALILASIAVAAQSSKSDILVEAPTPRIEKFSLPSGDNHLLGNWDGRRSRLAAEGITFDFYYISDFFGNPYGGESQGFTDWGRIRGTVDVDLGKLTETNAPTFHITALWQNGGDLGTKYLGSIANPSSLVSSPTFRLDSWWFQQALFNKHLLLRGGQFGGQDTYGFQEYYSSYLLEPLGYAFGNLFSATYESFDPASTPAAEVKIVPNKHLYVKSAVLSGNRNPYADDTTGFRFVIKDAPVVASEVGYLTGPPDLNASSLSRKIYPGKYKFGSIYNTGNFTDPVNQVTSRGNYLLYFMANQAIYRQDPGSNRGVDVNFAIDWSPEDVNQQNEQITGGIRLNGPIARRGKDTFALGFVDSKISDHFNRSYALQSLPRLSSEEAFEANYMFQASQWLVLQPAVEYFEHLGAKPHGGNGVGAGFRLKISF
jgi:carbohydrate-selective porin OprB